MDIIYTGGKYKVYDTGVTTYNTLPIGTYYIEFNQLEGFSLIPSATVAKAEKVYGRKKKYSSIKLILSISLLILALVFIVLGVIYKGGKFTITLDKRLSSESGIVIYEDSEIKESKRKLSARDLEFMDNISIDWIPQNIDTESNGSHNGENYIA